MKLLQRFVLVLCSFILFLMGRTSLVHAVAQCNGSRVVTDSNCRFNSLIQAFSCQSSQRRTYCGWLSGQCSNYYSLNTCEVISPSQCRQYAVPTVDAVGCYVSNSSSGTSGGTPTPVPTTGTNMSSPATPPPDYFCTDWCTNAGDGCPAGCSGAPGVCTNGGSCCSCSTTYNQTLPWRCTDGGVTRTSDVGRKCGYRCPGSTGNCEGNTSWSGGAHQNPDGTWSGGGGNCSAPIITNYDWCTQDGANSCCDGPPYGKCEIAYDFSSYVLKAGDPVSVTMQVLYSEVGIQNVGLKMDNAPVGLSLGATAGTYIANFSAPSSGAHQLQLSFNNGADLCNAVPFTVYAAPVCSLKVNGTIANASTPVNVIEGSSVSFSAESRAGDGSVVSTMIAKSAYAPPSSLDWPVTERYSGVASASGTWTAAPINGVRSVLAVCNNVNGAGACSGNPCTETNSCSPWTDCGSQDKVVVNVMQSNLACNAVCISDAQCSGSNKCLCADGTTTCTSSAKTCRNLQCPAEPDCMCSATIAGTLFDATQNDCVSISSAPKLSGYVAQAVNTANTVQKWAATGDASGGYSISGVPVPGSYQLGVDPAQLQSGGWLLSPAYACKSNLVTLGSSDSGASIIGMHLGYWKSTLGWFQVLGGNILAEQKTGVAIQSKVPSGCSANVVCPARAMLARATSDPASTGFPVVGQGATVESTIDTGIPYARMRQDDPQTFGARTRSANIGSQNYAYYLQRYSLPADPKTLVRTDISAYRTGLQNLSTELPANPERGAYMSTGDVTISDRWDVTSSQNIVIFVRGNLIIHNMIKVAPGGFLAFIVSGDITVGSDVFTTDENSISPLVEGVYIADGSIVIASNGPANSNPADNKFIGAGSFVGWSGIKLNRDYRAGSTDPVSSLRSYNYPAELFVDRPDFALNMPEAMKRPSIDWREIAP